MKITKFGHSCLLVETETPTKRTVLFDPGTLSHVDETRLTSVDDILITHKHEDHLDKELILKLQSKFPNVRIVTPEDARSVLEEAGVRNVVTIPPKGITTFSSPHEVIKPFIDSEPPEENGYHYLDVLTHPGDSHSFNETKPILALPVQAPWGSVVDAVSLGIKLRPKYVLPIHDWHWSDKARDQIYAHLEHTFKGNGITFIKLQNGEPVVLEA